MRSRAETKYLPSHITPEAHLDNFDKSRYEVRAVQPDRCS